MELVGGEGWELSVPPEWEAEEDGEFITIIKDEDGGAITVSAIIDEEENISQDELEIYSRSKLSKGDKLTKLEVGEFQGFSAQFTDEKGVAWFHSWLAHQDLLVYFSYNGSPEAWESEKKDVQKILKTLKVRDEG